MKQQKPVVSNLPRGRIVQWSRERLDALSTIELRQLFTNAQRLNETELAAVCDELLGARPMGRPRVKRLTKLSSFADAFEKHGVSLRSKRWSRGGIRSDGAVVVGIPANEVRSNKKGDSCLLWAPNEGNTRPWSDTPGGLERLEHCRIAHERGAAEGLLTYSKRAASGSDEDEGIPPAPRVDAETTLSLRVEKVGEQYWAHWTKGATA